VERKKRYMVYVKGGDDVAQLLRVMGAHSAVLTLESVRVLRGVRGDVNRVVNCETANVTKAVDAGLSQVEAIQKIDEVIGLRSLALGLQEIAELRLANPEMTLRELGQMLSPPISKSAVNHRMRRLIHLAKRLNGKAG
jgi:DNA-binding protein WhiA